MFDLQLFVFAGVLLSTIVALFVTARPKRATACSKSPAPVPTPAPPPPESVLLSTLDLDTLSAEYASTILAAKDCDKGAAKAARDGFPLTARATADLAARYWNRAHEISAVLKCETEPDTPANDDRETTH